MIRNEKGGALLTVFLVFIVLTTIGMAIMSATINASKRTEEKNKFTTDQQIAFTTIDEAINALKIETKKGIFTTNAELKLPELSSYQNFLGELSGNVANKLATISSTYKVVFEKDFTSDIQDQSKPYINTSQYYIRRYKVKLATNHPDYSNKNKNVSKTIYLTPTPSFLKFAIGSEGSISLNGGSYINGDVYIGGNGYDTSIINDTFQTMKDAYFYIEDDSTSYKQTSDLPAVNPSSRLYFGNETSLNNSAPLLENYNFRLKANYYKNEYLPVNLLKTFDQKLSKAAGNFSSSLPNPTVESIKQNLVDNMNNFISVTGAGNLSNQLPSPTRSIVLNPVQGEDTIYLDLDRTTDTNWLNLESNRWLIINGNAELVASKSTSEFGNLKANILVMGDLLLSGNLNINANIYVLGDTDVNSAKISSDASNGKLVLMSHGELRIGVIDEFENNIVKPNLEGYFYTDKNATIYGVGSYIYIKGGLFARGDGIIDPSLHPQGNLTINALRGTVTSLDKDSKTFNFTPEMDVIKSRFKIETDPTYSLLTNPTHIEGLPLADGIDIIVSKTTVR